MAEQTTIELAAVLSPDLLERLQSEAERQQLPLTEVVRDAISTYFEVLDEDDETAVDEAYEDTPDEVILDSLRESLKDALAGRNLRPAREVLDEIRRELDEEDADAR